MRTSAGTMPTMQTDAAALSRSSRSAGSGVYEIPVGPVHAGLIEPGHFRFSVVGETILKMTARLWFVHRGIERLFQGRDVEEGVELAERISGDSAVGHNLAYCLAVEEALGIEVPTRRRRCARCSLELERIYNHVRTSGRSATTSASASRRPAPSRFASSCSDSTRGHRPSAASRRDPAWTRPRCSALPTRRELGEIGERFEELVASRHVKHRRHGPLRGDRRARR